MPIYVPASYTAKAWSGLYDAVLPSLPGLPTGAPADFIIKRAAIEFCDRSLAWRVAIPTFDATAAEGNYVLPPPVTESAIVRITEFRFLGRELFPATTEWLNDHYGFGQNWRSVTADPPVYWTSEGPNQITIAPLPVSTTVGALSGWCAVKPSDLATGIDDAIWSEYHDTIAKIAIATAQAMPKKPYTDKENARSLRKEIDAAIGFIGHQRARGGGSAAFRTKTHWI